MISKIKKSGPFVICASRKGAVTITNPIRIEIMRALTEGECSFDELVCLVKRAKSTVSVHLERLERDGLISSKEHPEDRRKKIFFTTSQLIGASGVPKDELSQSIKDRIRDSKGKPFEFIHELFRAILYSLESCGINTTPALRTTGRQIGREISGSFSSDNLRDLLKEIVEFWKVHRIGNLKFINKKPDIEVIAEDCFYCGGMPNVGRTLCALDEGMLESIINTKLGLKSCVTEVECNGLGNGHCKFVIQLNTGRNTTKSVAETLDSKSRVAAVIQKG